MAPITSKDHLEPELRAPGLDVRGTQMGDMAVGFETWPVGKYEDLFRGLPDGCQAAHYGYVLKGHARLMYADGTTEDAKAGTVYYARPGHTFEVLEEFSVVEFTPADATYEQTMKVFEKNIPAFLQARGLTA